MHSIEHQQSLCVQSVREKKMLSFVFVTLDSSLTAGES